MRATSVASVAGDHELSRSGPEGGLSKEQPEREERREEKSESESNNITSNLTFASILSLPSRLAKWKLSCKSYANLTLAAQLRKPSLNCVLVKAMNVS